MAAEPDTGPLTTQYSVINRPPLTLTNIVVINPHILCFFQDSLIPFLLQTRRTMENWLMPSSRGMISPATKACGGPASIPAVYKNKEELHEKLY